MLPNEKSDLDFSLSEIFQTLYFFKKKRIKTEPQQSAQTIKSTID